MTYKKDKKFKKHLKEKQNKKDNSKSIELWWNYILSLSNIDNDNIKKRRFKNE